MAEISGSSLPAGKRSNAVVRRWHGLVGTLSPIVIFVGLVLAILPFVTGSFYYLGLAQLIAIYTIGSLGVGLLLGFAGQFTMGQGAVYAVGAYASAILATKLGWPVWISIVAAVAISGVVGLILGLPALRLRTHYLAMVTLGFALITPQLILNWEPLTGGWAGLSGIPRPSIGDYKLTRMDYYWVVLVAALVALWMTYNLLRSRWRLALLAIHDSELAASSLGISVYRTKLVAFLIASILTGLAGALYAHYLSFISPDNFTLHMSIFFILTVVIGGAATLSGPMWGSLIFVMLPEFLVDLKTYSLVVYGALLIVSQAFIPEGLVGAVSRLTSRFRRPPSTPSATLTTGALMSKLYEVPATSRGNGNGLLNVQGLSKHFGGLAALQNIDLCVRPGSIHGLIGPNGSGKTTMLNLISGYYTPTAGSVSFCDRVLNRKKTHSIALQGIGRTYQTPKVFPHLTVLENVMVGLFVQERATAIEAMLNLPRAVADRKRSTERARDLLRFVGLYERQNEMAKNLPHGQQRFLEIARALALEPSLILLDEPAAGLSGEEIDRLIDLILRLKDCGCAVLIVEHHVDMLMRLVDWVTVLDSGQRIADGLPDDVRRSPKVIEAYLGTTA